MNIGQVSKRVDSISPFYVMDIMARAKELEEAGRDIIHMEVGEPDFSTPKPIIDAAQRFLDIGEVHYTKAQGLPLLRDKIANFYRQEYLVEVSPERIFITPGASGALTVALASLLDEGDEVLTCDPGYPCNDNIVTLFGGRAKPIAVDASQNFQLTGADITQAWTPATRGVMIASPSNPTGTMVNRSQLDDIAQTVKKHQGFLISDEIYHGLVYGQRAISALEISDDVFVLNSFSKFFGMTGWRLGWLIVPDYAVSAANRLMQNLYIAAPTHSQYAALAAFSDETRVILNQRRDEFECRRDMLYDGLKQLGFVLLNKPEGAFYIYADCRAFTDDSYTFSLELLDKAGVATTPGKDFGISAPERYLRFAYTTSTERIEEGLRRIKAFLAGW
ncbi:MAG: aminotransferase class I/II-fold pyridoxal phosphate-dependent enzyme [Cycloclasticus sp.]|jgi:aspartate/methionine/tyrosine aminotransferase|nr:aminotransferase class I/II-fold pyridoxal phosphate-dependent enzyme [Cycloclasticus sp.]MEE4290348.1 aminotransferase class I/II-fold pyridoxal phosphate-dependent enzyme [Cycloclasticus sp.]